MSLDVVVDDDRATLRVEPEYGRPVTFVVEKRSVNVARDRSGWGRKNMQDRFVVSLAGSTEDGFVHHADFYVAVRAALSRARRYERAYAKPRGLAAAS